MVHLGVDTVIVLCVVAALRTRGLYTADHGARDAVIQRNGLAGECTDLGPLTVMKRRAELSTRRMDPLSAGTVHQKIECLVARGYAVSAD